jgi:hypothetical protein
MPHRLRPGRPSAPMAVSLVALFLSMGGVGIAATGGNFILGVPNSATTRTTLTAPVDNKALQITNTSAGADATALGLNVAAGKPPLTVNSSTKVARLNADLFDNLDSTAFLRNRVPLSLSGSVASPNGVIGGTNSGNGFGVVGRASTLGGVGVGAENLAGGRAMSAVTNGVNPALSAHNLGSGINATALQLQTPSDAPPMTVNSSEKVTNLNADMVDGASVLSNRIFSSTNGDEVLVIPGLGQIEVADCDSGLSRWSWTGVATSTDADLAVVDLFNPADKAHLTTLSFTSASAPDHFALLQLSRDTGASTRAATVSISARASDCEFAAHAVVQQNG